MRMLRKYFTFILGILRQYFAPVLVISPAVDETLFTPTVAQENLVLSRESECGHFQSAGLVTLLCWWIHSISPRFLMPWVSICLYAIPSWCCHLDSWRTSHDTAGLRSAIFFTSVVSSFSGLDKSVTFLASSSGSCFSLVRRCKFKTLKTPYAAFLPVIFVSCYRFCTCLNNREYISTSRKVSQKYGCQENQGIQVTVVQPCLRPCSAAPRLWSWLWENEVCSLSLCSRNAWLCKDWGARPPIVRKCL